ncbi:MAG: hypothetical protein HZB26_04825 [Candidatus Hydrogenedentes bacterium]|nr:hypothetical protein [Candidatus Hydrogenedentota bacterium]
MPLVAIVLAGLAASDANQGGASQFQLSFDAGLTAAGDIEPVTNELVRFVAGHSALAAEFVKGAVLTYPTTGHYDPACGTLSMWVRPNWDSVHSFGDRFFWGIANPGANERTVLGFLGKDGLGVVYFGGDGALMGLAAPVDWRAGEWHQLTVCWDQAAKCRALYIDGRLRHRIHTTARMPDKATVFHVGSLPCTTRWMGVPDGHEADAAIDDLTLSTTIEMPGFGLVRQAAREDEKAASRNQQSREKAQPAYESARERFLAAPTLDGVAEQRHEATWDELAGMAAPMTQRVPIEPRYYSDVVYVHPDLSIALGRANEAYGLGFACGDPFQLPDMYTVTRKLHQGYQPIVESRWTMDSCEIGQTAFTILPRDEETVTGKEPQYVVVRMAVRNTTAQARKTPLFVLMGRLHDTQNTNYAPFLGSASRWLEPVLPITVEKDAVLLDGHPLMTIRTKPDVKAMFVPEFSTGTTDPLLPEALRNVLRFDFELAPNETATVDLVVVATPERFPSDETGSTRQTTFDGALARAEKYWDKGLEAGMKLTTPEPRLNDVYRSLILSCLGNLRKNPNRPWHEPFQSPVWEGVWPWECAHVIVPMCALGYHRELEPTLRFFTERQSGIGQYAEPGRKPEGETKSAYGCYTGNFLLRWTCETGSVLWAMAAKYRYSRDGDWLKQNKDCILAAWDWIQGERARTRRFTNAGERVPYYGLMPKGRVHDWEGWHYVFFSDVFTWKGMAEMAAAFQSAELPHAARLQQEADEYRECLLAAIHRAEYKDPATNLDFVPNLVPTYEGEHGGLWWADGPACMFATGLLDARTDPRFGAMFSYLQQTWGTMIGLTNRMDEPVELGRRNPFWYVNCSERGYFQNLLARGEVEKGLLIFYSNLAYGLSQDCYQTVERIHVSDANYSPFQPNASGNGRLLDMIRRMVIDDQDPGVIWLLRGCPRRWFAPGQSIVVEDAPTYAGTMALCTRAEDGAIVIDIDPPQGNPSTELRVVLRHPGAKPPTKITVNGVESSLRDAIVALKEPKGHQQIVCRF